MSTLADRETTDYGDVRAPVWPAIAVCVVALTALGCAVASLRLGAPIMVPIAGYVAGCILSVAFASTHRALENRERSNPRFRLQPSLGRIVKVGMALGVVGGLACAFALATELAK